MLRALEVSGETEPTLSSAEVDNGLTSVEALMHSYHKSNHIYILHENKRNIGFSVSLLNVFSLLKFILYIDIFFAF